ncbi:hypothetical protein, partial [Deinococcus sp. GbtcB9]|uniref:hypothetical protein n=1 Tax=Deinococcus sp. GbtcB9 TaxID=2824754 RepID=UPI001C302040
EDFNLMYVTPWMREALLLTKRGRGHGPVYWGGLRDGARGLRTIVYRYSGPAPEVTLRVADQEASPFSAKSFGLEYAGRAIVMQHVL